MLGLFVLWLCIGLCLLSCYLVVCGLCLLTGLLIDYWKSARSAEQRQRDFLTAACLGIAAVQGLAIAYAPLDRDPRQMNLQFEDVLP
ncbi:hypothetical protein [Xanthomonas euvesicatoria]|uniref:hypothetical protein n=1 Tax=Xanthomonas euvesicatoria TaxID=456327 RepID=UPI00062D2303|nr:hypothetical protein [Xanthomonas euvesicatoria]APO90438.1 hypothetical protein BJD11_10605 [Xanthomonas euvesicatoria]KLB35677.1 hypothetical protein XEUV206_23415 [Xanthomonas euvesicatoria]MCC8584040.1 hypothetical protein [Xanthomonas euvesicatoria pv. euvesicatoria]MCC8593919.1 hypothetical protein [Xanthomonas euvesicatoria pv. euvesicatoria]